MGEIVEGDGCVWMLLPSDQTVSVRTDIRAGETANEAACRLATALGRMCVDALMSTVAASGTTSPTELARARKAARNG